LRTRCSRERRVAHLAIAVALLASCGSGPGLEELPIPIPSESDWNEVGIVLEAGPEGAWDRHFAGASSPSTILQHEGRWWLYYGGADGLRDDDEGPRHRAIGLATSSDGVRFERHGNAPVLSHLPGRSQEEGANSAALSLAPDGRFVAHYGAATAFTVDQIHADLRVAHSTDGVQFEDAGLVLSYQDPAVYGSGDELFPLASYRYDGTWYVFYTPNGTRRARELAVAWGPSERVLEDSRRVLDGSTDDPARCAANVVLIGDHVIVFVQRGWNPDIRAEVRVAPAAAPWKLGRPLRVWDGPLFSEQTKFYTVALDTERSTWLLYRLDWNDRIHLHTAPAGAPDTTPPSVPTHLSVRPARDGIHLTWDEAEDPDTGIGQYRIRCGGELVAETLQLEWRGRTGATQCAVSAVNLHGREGPAAALRLAEKAR
jgi:hypothetical protein